ncbi:YfiR family protein [Pseudoalteromonas sp. SSDWG2]|uniref:YfiR family protein n=1 Tax=Pseudoalteromonas sp. SSDWG2 TaxID=3139391 RepID=UPI003BACECD3
MRLLFVTLMLISLCVNAAQPLADLRANKLVKIAHFVDFTHAQSTAIRFCFYDLSTGVGQAFIEKPDLEVNPHPVDIIDLSESTKNPELLGRCDITYFEGKVDNDILAPWLKILPVNTLVIGDNFEFLANGGVIALIQEGDKIRLYVNKESLEQVNFKIQARLLSISKFYPN